MVLGGIKDGCQACVDFDSVSPWQVVFAVWMLTQMKRLGPDQGRRSTTSRVAEAGLSLSRTDTRQGLMARDGADAAVDVVQNPFSVMGKTFDPTKPGDDYLASFKIREGGR